MSIQKYKQLTKARLGEGRLIKTSNEYTPNTKSIELICKKTTSDLDVLNGTILRNLTYLGFDDMLLLLMKAFQLFMQNLPSDQNYAFVYAEDNNKSDIWILLLLLRYGKRFLGDVYREPIEIINLSKVSSPLSKDIVYVFCDDFIFSGTQMGYNVESFRSKYSIASGFRSNIYNDGVKIYIVCAGASTYSMKRLGEQNIFKGKIIESLKEIIQRSDLQYNVMKKVLNTNFPQPFIDRFDYMNNIPMYMEYKMPDTMSSFPELFRKIVNNCTLDDDTNIVDGSSMYTKCAHPFYKVVNDEKGKQDVIDEDTFIKKIIERFT